MRAYIPSASRVAGTRWLSHRLHGRGALARRMGTGTQCTALGHSSAGGAHRVTLWPVVREIGPRPRLCSSQRTGPQGTTPCSHTTCMPSRHHGATREQPRDACRCESCRYNPATFVSTPLTIAYVAPAMCCRDRCVGWCVGVLGLPQQPQGDRNSRGII